MAIARSAPVYEEEVGGIRRPLLLRNGEIERFEEQHAPLGVLGLWDRLRGQGTPPQMRHVRDLVALGLVGGGMADRQADDLVAGLDPSHTHELVGIATRLLGVTFWPVVLRGDPPKKADGSPDPEPDPGPSDPTDAGTPEAASSTSAA